ncbi:hypothetical protein CY34DRAFT_18912 [Suillus luteus UH-Slu-Lm8-n1]|uniref:Uncharacterized protein n=1 Tax=Suillus luteus UH-Slu-Lm8-n1 TaxID=930992 RepID=A0A0C9Z5D2_9AGAM|nr:hypothetical protein CY34DRAFT_18912 [Suillus luteus UH-Slu-Lm8-n1]
MRHFRFKGTSTRLTFVFAIPSRLSSTYPVLSFYDLLTVNPSLFIAKSTTARLSIPFAVSSLKIFLRDLHATSAFRQSPIARLFHLALPPTSRIHLLSH